MSLHLLASLTLDDRSAEDSLDQHPGARVSAWRSGGRWAGGHGTPTPRPSGGPMQTR